MSSWCQYEALKFVSFPTQVLILLRRILCLRNKCLKILERLLILHYLYKKLKI
jgi:hypothetical protein